LRPKNKNIIVDGMKYGLFSGFLNGFFARLSDAKPYHRIEHLVVLGGTSQNKLHL